MKEWGKHILTGGIHREEIVFGQLLFAVEFSHFGADEIGHGVHQTGERNGSWADAANKKLGQSQHPVSRCKGQGGRTHEFPAATLKSSS